MNWNHMKTRILICGLLLGLSAQTLQANQKEQFESKVNLALRQIGHHLLLQQHDSTSRIAPVEHDGNQGYLLPINRAYDYASLPQLLKQAFLDFDITAPYELMVKECDSERVLLGFNKAAVERNEVACGGREQPVGCSNIFVQFSMLNLPQKSENSALPWLLLPLLAGVVFFLYKKTESPSEEAAIPNPTDSHKLSLGQFSFDPKNQILTIGSEELNLTFRENKLLHLFAKQPNEVLTRSEILSNVWEDEGVIVGRSLDVFISRIRKMLKKDPSVQLKNVHGVGYRLDIK